MHICQGEKREGTSYAKHSLKENNLRKHIPFDFSTEKLTRNMNLLTLGIKDKIIKE
jgi:hypothetical protein